MSECCMSFFFLFFLNLQPHQVPHRVAVYRAVLLLDRARCVNMLLWQCCSQVFKKSIHHSYVFYCQGMNEWNEIKWHDPRAVICDIWLVFVFHYPWAWMHVQGRETVQYSRVKAGKKFPCADFVSIIKLSHFEVISETFMLDFHEFLNRGDVGLLVGFQQRGGGQRQMKRLHCVLGRLWTNRMRSLGTQPVLMMMMMAPLIGLQLTQLLPAPLFFPQATSLRCFFFFIDQCRFISIKIYSSNTMRWFLVYRIRSFSSLVLDMVMISYHGQ